MKKIISTLLVLALSALLLVSCGSEADSKVIRIAASSTPHAEILEQCREALEAKGYTLEIVPMDDYVIPNTATEDGEVDANYFQHVAYLTSFNADYGTHLVSVEKIHYEPLGIYGGTASSLTDIPDGAKIAVPNDKTNEARALMLLEAAGLLTLKEGAGLNATKNDIAENPHSYEIVEMEAALVSTVLDEVALGVINGNYALKAGLNVADAFAKEGADSDAAQLYANIIVVKEGHENDEKIQALCEALKTEKVSSYINNTYGGAVVPLF